MKAMWSIWVGSRGPPEVSAMPWWNGTKGRPSGSGFAGRTVKPSTST